MSYLVQHGAREIVRDLMKDCRSDDDIIQAHAWAINYYEGLFDGEMIDKEELDKLRIELTPQHGDVEGKTKTY